MNKDRDLPRTWRGGVPAQAPVFLALTALACSGSPKGSGGGGSSGSGGASAGGGATTSADDAFLQSLGHRSDEWLADMIVLGSSGLHFEAYGVTAQVALDALAAVVPSVPLSRGGTC